MDMTRRSALATAGGALLAAGASALSAAADEGKNGGDTLYGHGMVWNRSLEGDAAELRLAFDLRLDLKAATGVGSAEDGLLPAWNMHFDIASVTEEQRPGGETRFTMAGEVTAANNPANVGQPVRILAETAGDTTAVAIRIGSLSFAGAGILVSGLLLPAKYK